MKKANHSSYGETDGLTATSKRIPQGNADCFHLFSHIPNDNLHPGRTDETARGTQPKILQFTLRTLSLPELRLPRQVFDAECINLSSRFGIDPSRAASAIERPNQHQFPKEKHGLLGIIDCFRTVRPKEDKQSMPSFRCGAYGLIFSVQNRPFGNCIGNQTSEPTSIP